MKKSGHKKIKFILFNILLLYFVTFVRCSCHCGGDDDSPPPASTPLNTCVGSGQHVTGCSPATWIDNSTQYTPGQGECDTHKYPLFPTAQMTLCCIPGSDNTYGSIKSDVASDPEKCKQCNPLYCLTSTAEANVASGAGKSAQAALQEAQRFMNGTFKGKSVALASPTAGPLVNQEAASAGGAVDSSHQSKGNTSSAPSAGSAVSGSIKNSKSNNSIFGSLFSDEGTTAATEGSGQIADPKGSGSGGDSNIAEGVSQRSGGHGITGRVLSSFGFGSQGMSGDHSESSIQTTQFGETGGSDVKAILGEDPEDYFTRIDLDQDLFRIIHNRYQTKAASWLSQELNVPGKATPTGQPQSPPKASSVSSQQSLQQPSQQP